MRAAVVCVWLVLLVCGSVLPARGVDKRQKVETPTERAWRILTDGVNAKKFSDRVIALKAMAELGPNLKGVRLVSDVLKDKDPDLRAQAAATLGAMKSRAALPALRVALNDEAPQVSFSAAKSLWQLGDNAGRRVLLDVLQGDKGTKDGFVASHKREAKRELQDKKALVAMGAEKSAGEFLPGPLGMGVGLAKQQLASGTDPARADSADLLSRRPDKATMLALKAALMDRDWSVRAAAAVALGRLARPGTQQWLEYALDDGKAAVRDAAAVGILRMSARRSGASTYANLH
ncbi:MAG TPA: HEAT repeat domain-containing protein [Terriglobales bacterium]|nr:HEAT repeat domain-containing protein [Terriglobales bacterium]